MMYLMPIEDLNVINQLLGDCCRHLREKKIFLTGATGFIGKSLLEALLWLNKENNLNLEIYSISRNPAVFFKTYPHFLSHPEFKLYSGDICDDIDGVLVNSLDLTIHAATDVVNKTSSIDLFSSCVKGTSNVINFSRKKGCNKFLLLSSGAVYGRQPEHCSGFTESYIGGVDLSHSLSAYSLGKQVSEWLVQQSNCELMEVKIARCFAFIGPYLPLNKHFAIGNFIQSALRGENINILGDGTPLRTYLYTSDLCYQLLKILLDTNSGSVWNVGGSEPISIKQVAELVREELNPCIKINVHKSPGIRVEKYIPDITKITTELMVKQSVNLRLAIQKTANWNLNYANLN